MKTYYIRTFLTITILAMAAFIAQRVFTHMQVKSQATATIPLQEQQGADAWIQGFSYHQTRASATKWVVTADQAKVFDADHIAKLQAVKVQLFDQDFHKEQLLITSEEGVMNTATNDFNLVSRHEKTVMTFESGYQVFSDTLTWKEDARQIHTDDSVMIQGGGLVMTGTGLIGDVEKNEFQLLHNVRAEVSSP
ncbi:MAG: LPS export ABC transporter periplasmic protein LptC [Nitrospirota bacterium]|nr:LPS export ABC transporter periplasmic protein LptC [Nitrospirota bacterium]MDH5586218.1 LPS export ABC transporter periplasmic protein LptC [Nitrospirota bacterium]MDH5774170.1 LPS export ABC transporter periplasmic protein LptC [Nitrospirota bacterium]